MITKILPIVILFLVNTQCEQIIDQLLGEYRDPFFETHRFEGQWNQLEVQQPLGPCEPCYYMIQMYEDRVLMMIGNPGSGQSKTVMKYHANITQPDQFGILSGEKYNLIGDCLTDQKLDGQFQFKLEKSPQNGMTYAFEISVIDLGLYISFTQTQDTYWMSLLTIVYTCLYMIVFPISREAIEKNIREVINRTNPIVLSLYTLNSMLIVSFHLMLVIFYLWHCEGIISKLIFYTIFGTSFMISIIQFGYGFASIQNSVDRYFGEESSCKHIGLMAIGLIMIMSPLLLWLVHKGIWFYSLFIGSVIVQIGLSLKNQIYPCWRLMILFSMNIGYLGMLTASYPILNYQELSGIQLLVLIVGLAILLGGSYKYLGLKIPDENVVDLVETKRTSQSNENRETNGHNQQFLGISEFQLKSDIELSTTKGAI